MCLNIDKGGVYILVGVVRHINIRIIRFEINSRIIQKNMADFTPFKSFATDAIHAGQEPEQWASMAVIPPISLSTTFKQAGPNDFKV